MVDSRKDITASVPANSLSSQESTTNHNAEEKQSPSDKSDLTMTDSAAACHALVQEEILPLSGNSFFTCILGKSNIQSPFQMVVPRSFTVRLPAESVTVKLSCRNKTWEIGYYGGATLRRFDPRWKTFAADNKLKVGDAVIFELMDNKDLRFRVQILDGSLPSKVNNSDAPILIDD